MQSNISVRIDFQRKWSCTRIRRYCCWNWNICIIIKHDCEILIRGSLYFLNKSEIPLVFEGDICISWNSISWTIKSLSADISCIFQVANIKHQFMRISIDCVFIEYNLSRSCSEYWTIIKCPKANMKVVWLVGWNKISKSNLWKARLRI